MTSTQPPLGDLIEQTQHPQTILNAHIAIFPQPYLRSYDKIIVYFSGGKDSLACLLHLLKQGVPVNKIELWHHEIDGREGSKLMDWACTPDYCRKIAEAFNVPIFFSWKVAGFEGEMMRKNSLTAPTKFETPEGEIKQIGGTGGKANTRLKFPQVSANLSVRWCSAYLKIDVAAAALRNQKRFNNSRTLVISGERAEESTARANYLEFEPDRTDNRGRMVTQLKPYQHLPALVYKPSRSERHVDRWRPVHQWSEEKVWAIIERFKVNPHPAYHLGWGRVSCQFCIFGSDDQWASCKQISSERFEEIKVYEGLFETTIHRTKSVNQRALDGQAYMMYQEDIDIANSASYTEPVFVEDWTLPTGAFGENCGPI